MNTAAACLPVSVQPGWSCGLSRGVPRSFFDHADFQGQFRWCGDLSIKVVGKFASQDVQISAKDQNESSCKGSKDFSVAGVKVTHINFDYGAGAPAIHLRQDYSTAYNLTNGEWTAAGGSTIPVCYPANRIFSFKARFAVQPSGLTNAIYRATMSPVAAGSSGSLCLGTNCYSTVSFPTGGGESDGGTNWTMFSSAGTATNCVLKMTGGQWQWQMRGFNTTVTTNVNMNVSGPYTVYTILDTPAAPWSNAVGNTNNVWTMILDYACNWASGTRTANAAINDILNNGFAAHYTWNYDCNRLSSDFVRIMTLLGIPARQHCWASLGSPSSGALDDMCYQRTKAFTPAGGSFGVREWSWHQWAECGGLQVDPSAASFIAGSWGDYEDTLFTRYLRCTNATPFAATWVMNNAGQSVGCEIYPTHCIYEPNPTLYDWRGPDR
ncbi:MAG: hypothetical protein PHV34_13155 [Verrucomicrobiae bacterium]|nr:hypothetical protein [Verrucomicrobiae bacterium]